MLCGSILSEERKSEQKPISGWSSNFQKMLLLQPYLCYNTHTNHEIMSVSERRQEEHAQSERKKTICNRKGWNNMRIYEIVTCFFIYAILGWCTEVIYAAFKERKFVNRGFLNGPICPIYGFGVLAVTLILRDYQDDLLLLFFMSLSVATLLEWATGFLLEKLFHHKWWDYSDMAFNIQGYICPLFSLIWGIACVFVVKLMHPFVQKLIHFIPEMVEKGILLLVLAGFAADLYVTIHEILKLNVRLRKMQEIADELTNLSEHLGENLSRNVITGMEKQENMKEKVEERYREYMADVSYTGRRLLEAFPKMESLHYRQQLQDIKQHLAKMRLSKRIRERRTEKDRKDK